MALVHLLSAAPDGRDFNHAPLRCLLASAVCDRFGIHRLTEDPSAAELILFAELTGAGLHFEAVRRHPLVRRYREKCFVFSSHAYVIPLLPGVYPSVEKQWASRRTCSGFHVSDLQNPFTSFTPPSDDLPHLFSFIGSRANAPVRAEVLKLAHPRSVVMDTADEFARLLRGDMTELGQSAYFARFAAITKGSKFVLCPRGVGAATIRLIETMKMGRVPVIISDNWVEPEGVDWPRCSIRVRERDVAAVPSVLAAQEANAVAMGLLAHEEWDRWFSDEVAFHRVVEWCLKIRDRRLLPEALARWPAYLQLLRPFHLRYSIRETVRAQHRKAAARAMEGLSPSRRSALL